MSRLLEAELRRLDGAVTGHSARVEDAVRRAALALRRRDAGQALEVARAQAALRPREDAIEEECLKLIALHQPVAGPLRHLIGVVKMNLHLGRAGGLAVNLARKARALAALPPAPEPPGLGPMAEGAVDMLHEAISAFVADDLEAARAVIGRDREVDRGKRAVRRACEAALGADPAQARQQIVYLGAARNLERLADMAVAVARSLLRAADGDPDGTPGAEGEGEGEGGPPEEAGEAPPDTAAEPEE